MDTSTLPCRPLTVDDLEDFPSDGHRYELVDGVLLVSPPPVPPHQVMATRLTTLLVRHVSTGMEVLGAPVGVARGPGTWVEPDVSVVHVSDIGSKRLLAPPVLVVEVLSPSSRRTDPQLKRAVYEEIGIPSYWIADPDEPGVTALELDDGGRYVERGCGSGSDVIDLTRPFPVRIVPADLVL